MHTSQEDKVLHCVSTETVHYSFLLVTVKDFQVKMFPNMFQTQTFTITGYYATDLFFCFFYSRYLSKQSNVT